jgi:hypothetical protein
MIFVPAYWPMFKTKELRRFDYTVDDGTLKPISSVFSYDVGSDSMLYNEYDEGEVWRDVWYYQYRPGFGIAEYRDDYPGGKKVVMDPPIGWGEWANVGDTYTNSPKMDPFKSWPPAMAQGFQAVKFEALLDEFTLRDGTSYPNVLQFVVQQSWSGNPPGGGRYWMACDVGPIAIQWIAQKADGTVVETSRLDAVVTRFNV